MGGLQPEKGLVILLAAMVATAAARTGKVRLGSDEDPVTNNLLHPHPTNCSVFYQFVLQVGYCPQGLQFNPKAQVCDLPSNLDSPCTEPVVGCQQLADNERSHWEPKECATTQSITGDKCRLVCYSDYEQSGSTEITCTDAGWNGTGGVNQFPSCKTIEEIGDDIVNDINKTLAVKANLLFVMDESGNVGSSQFDIELKFVKALVQAFPLSANRSSGVISFASDADVDIDLNTQDTCSFLEQLDRISYSQGATNTLAALELAIKEIEKNAVHDMTLVFLITDGESTTDPTSAAETIKKNKDILITLGVAGYDENQLIPLSSVDEKGVPLFYGISSFEVIDAVTDYLNTQYNNDAVSCP